jgi:CRP/FNR family transcriptional regulator, cyclic AMP receptor protein
VTHLVEYLAGVQEHRAASDVGKVMIDFVVFHFAALGYDVSQEQAKLWNIPCAVAQLGQQPALGFVAVDLEREIEGATRGDDAKLIVEHNKGLLNSVHYRMRMRKGIPDVSELRLNIMASLRSRVRSPPGTRFRHRSPCRTLESGFCDVPDSEAMPVGAGRLYKIDHLSPALAHCLVPLPLAGLPPSSIPKIFLLWTLYFVRSRPGWANVGVPPRTKSDMANKTNQASFDPRVFLAKVGEGTTILEYRKDQIVFAQGDVADSVFYIQKGRVKVVVISEQAKEAVVGILEPGQFFGEGCLNGHSLRIATTTAMEECLVTAITKTAMLATLHSEPKFSEMFMAYLLTRNSRIEEDLIDQLFNSSEKRLARLLLLLANFGKEGSPQLISPNISQETLAEMIGTTRSRVSFFMNKFRKLGLISYNGKIEVHNSLLNAVLYDKPEINRESKDAPED